MGLIGALVAVTLAPMPAAAQGTILEVDGGTLTLSVGSEHGVRTGMKGEVVKPFFTAGGRRNHRVARFEVTEIEGATCTARVTRMEPGWLIEPGLGVVFSKPLANPPRPSPTATATPIRGTDISDKATGALQRSGSRSPADDRLAEARSRARQEVARRDWEAAVPWLEMLAREAPADRSLRDAIAWKRREARSAHASGDFEAARIACDQGLSLVNDPELRELRNAIDTATTLDRFQTTIDETRILVEALGPIGTRPAGQPVEHELMVELLERRAGVLRDLSTAAAAFEGRIPELFDNLMREVAGGAMVTVAGTSYLMGCTEGDVSCRSNEKPRRWVEVGRFMLDVTEVTVGQYRAFSVATGSSTPISPSFQQGGDHPVVNVSWQEAAGYCAWVGGRLPTEAEWELAARAGAVDRRYPRGDTIDHDDANYAGIEARDLWERTSPVGSFPPNPWGFYDVIGNVWEWSADSYTPGLGDPTGSAEVDELFASVKAIRGGSWLAHEGYLRASSRLWFPPDRRMFNVGLRCARDVDREGREDAP